MEAINAIGRRKAAVARVFLSEGTGKITINKRDIVEYFPSSILQFIVRQQLSTLEVLDKYDIRINLQGGGYKGQAEEARLVNSGALVIVITADSSVIRAEGNITSDLSVVERLKPRQTGASMKIRLSSR